MTDVLLYGDTERHPALRHEIPIGIGDPFLYAEVAGTTYVMASSLERDRIAAVRPDAELLDIEQLGLYELLRTGRSFEELQIELLSRAAARTGVRDAVVDFDFALGVAERLRADGIRLTVDDELIKRRRRTKSATELDGIRRAARGAEAAIAAAAAMLRRANAVDGALELDGEPLLAEQVRDAMSQACWEHGALLPMESIVASVWQGSGHEPGRGQLPAGLPIEIDVWPRDQLTGCWADMTRTFLVGGEPPEEVRRQERLVREAIERARDAAHPGVSGLELHALACDLFENAGYRTQRSGPGDGGDEGFQFSLGHGVGLEVHEDPGLGLAGRQPLIAGDVVAIEPGLWDRKLGGVRFEDLLLVTEAGCETLTNYSYELAP